MIPAINFKIFERKTFHDGGDMIEPRDMAIGDVDGDGRADLILVVHDRVLVYRQDPGHSPSKPESKPPVAARSTHEMDGMRQPSGHGGLSPPGRAYGFKLCP